MKRTIRFAWILPVVFSVLLAACGDDDPDEPDMPYPPVEDDDSESGSNTDIDDFDYFIGTDQNYTIKDEDTGEYMYDIYVGFGVSGMQSRGINEFGIVVRTDEDIYMPKDDYKDDTHHETFRSGYYIYGLLYDDKQKYFGDCVYVTTSKRSITLEFTPRWRHSKSGKYVEGKATYKTFTPWPH